MMETDLLTTLAFSTASSYLIQWLKNSPHLDGIINPGSKISPVIISAFMAAVASAGIHWQFQTDSGTLTIVGLTAANCVHAGADFLKSFVLNHVMYEKLVKPTPTK